MRKQAVVVFVSILAACSKAPPPAPAPPVESAGDALRRDNADIAKRLEEQKAATDQQFQDKRASEERARLANAFVAVRSKFSQTAEEASRATRDKMPPIVKQLETVRGEAAALESNSCLEVGKSSLLDAMDMAIDGLRQFVGETGAQSLESQEKLRSAAQRLSKADSELRKCY